jgi:hypothetical protein
MKYIYYLFIFLLTNTAFPEDPLKASVLGALMLMKMEVLLKAQALKIKNNYEKTRANTDISN